MRNVYKITAVKKTPCKNAQKREANFVNFVHILGWTDAIIRNVKTPNTLYSFCYTP